MQTVSILKGAKAIKCGFMFFTFFSLSVDLLGVGVNEGYLCIYLLFHFLEI